MTAAQIRALVDRGIAIRAEMATLKKELDDIEAKLEKAGLEGEQQELKDADREGRRFLARGSRQILPVTFTADKLIQSFAANSAIHKKIAQAAGRHLQSFYQPTTTYEIVPKDGKRFRAVADELLGKDGPALIAACVARDKLGVPKSDVKIEWGKLEEITEVAHD